MGLFDGIKSAVGKIFGSGEPDPGDITSTSGPARGAGKADPQIAPWADDFLEECKKRLDEFNATADKKSPEYPGALADIVNEVREEFERGYAKLGDRIPPGVKEILGDHLIGPEAYKKVFGVTDLGEIPPIPAHITKQLLNKSCRLINYRSFVADTHCLVFIPGKIDGEPFTVMKLAAIAESAGATLGRPRMFCDTSWLADETFANTPKEKGEWVLVPTLDLPHSRHRTYSQQEMELRSYSDYRVASALELATALIMNDLISMPSREQTGPYYNNFGCCSDATKFGGRVGVGVLDADGLDINFAGEDDRYHDLGLAIVRK